MAPARTGTSICHGSAHRCRDSECESGRLAGRSSGAVGLPAAVCSASALKGITGSAVLDDHRVRGIHRSRFGEQGLRLALVAGLPRLGRLLDQLDEPVLAGHGDRDGVVAVLGIEFESSHEFMLGRVQVVVLELLCAGKVRAMSLAHLALAGR